MNRELKKKLSKLDLEDAHAVRDSQEIFATIAAIKSLQEDLRERLENVRKEKAPDNKSGA